MRNLAQFFKALSDETRLQIIALLVLKEELCVCDIENILELTQSKASRHLRYLTNSGILKDKRKNVWVYYFINPSLSEEELEIIKALRKNIALDSWDELREKLEKWIETKKDCSEMPQACRTKQGVSYGK